MSFVRFIDPADFSRVSRFSREVGPNLILADDYTLPTCSACYSAPTDGDDLRCRECVEADRVPIALAIVEAIEEASRDLDREESR